jgi:uncharacterized hydantoinase/oxoprolinase family protein
MTKKNIKELADLSVSQCKEKLISLIKEFGDVEGLNIRVTISAGTFSDLAYIVAIKGDKIHYELSSHKEVYNDDISNFTIDELYKIVTHL